MAQSWKAVSVLALSLLLISSVYAPGLNAQIQEDEVDFEVLIAVAYEKGDSFWKLAEKYYGAPQLWPLIVYLNRIPDYNAVPEGVKIYIPVKEPKGTVLGKPATNRPSAELEELRQKLLRAAEQCETHKTTEQRLVQELSEKNDAINKLKTAGDDISTKVSAKIAELQKELLRASEERKALQAENKQLAKTLEERDSAIEKIEDALDKAVAASPKIEPPVEQYKDEPVIEKPVEDAPTHEPERGRPSRWKILLVLAVAATFVLSLTQIL